MNLDEALALHLSRVDQCYDHLRSIASDPKHLNSGSSESLTARKLLLEAVNDCFAVKNIAAQADYLARTPAAPVRGANPKERPKS
jgi:hypothetical protein